MNPRDRCGQVSIASAAPAGHSAPMPMPRAVRNSSSNQKLGARPARRLQTENQAIEIINGFLRPIRSASQPEAVAPTSRIHNVKVKTTATSVSGTPKSLEIGTISSRKMVKSKAVERPPEPSGDPGEPLILGWFFPPRDRLCSPYRCRHDWLHSLVEQVAFLRVIVVSMALRRRTVRATERRLCDSSFPIPFLCCAWRCRQLPSPALWRLCLPPQK